MNDGAVLVDGSADDARNNDKVRAIYIGSGTVAVAMQPRAEFARSDQLLAVDRVNTYYGKSHILNDVSFDVRKHEIIALLGRNGAGKSTLLKSLVGIARPKRALSDCLTGRPSACHRPMIARRGIGYVPQGRGLFAGMTVADNLMLGRLKRTTGDGIHWSDERIVAIFRAWPNAGIRRPTICPVVNSRWSPLRAHWPATCRCSCLMSRSRDFLRRHSGTVRSFDQLRQEIALIIVDHHLDLAWDCRIEPWYSSAAPSLGAASPPCSKMIWTCGGRCCGCEPACRHTCPAKPNVRYRGKADMAVASQKCPLMTQRVHHRALDDRAVTLSPNTVVASAGQRL